MDISDLGSFVGVTILNNWIIFIVTLLAVLLTKWIVKRSYAQRTLIRFGIPGPKPSLLLGNVQEISGYGMEKIDKIQEWIDKYGKVFGYYRGDVPVIVVTEPKIVESVLIKDFDHFIDRSKQYRFSAGPFQNMLVSLTQDRWKEVRSVLVPAFSSKKMKQMSPIVNSAVDILVEILTQKSQSGANCDIQRVFQGLTLQVIGECAFGITIESQKKPDDPFFLVLKNFFKSYNKFMATIWNAFPELGFLYHWFRLRGKQSWLYWLEKQLNMITTIRRKNLENNRVDVLQLMINTADRRPSFMRRSSMIDNEVNEVLKLSSPIRNLTTNEVHSQAFSFLLGGYEPITNTLTYIIYILVKYPLIQKKLQEEINDNFPPGINPDYESSQSLIYMDQVIQETLRLYPAMPMFVARVCTEESKIQGHTFPKDCEVLIPVWNIHHDPQVWPKPEQFDPERFTPEEKRSIPVTSYLAFGGGPRNCIGKPFALLEIKIALIRMLQNFTFVKGDGFKEELELQCPGSFLQPKDSVFVKIQARR